MPTGQRNKKNTLMKIAYEGIMQKIISEDFLPGTPLREEHLAEELGISPTPIREAFRRLEYEGWLQSSPYRGVFIREFSRNDIIELYQLRCAFESMAATYASRNATEDDFEKIQLTLEAEKKYIEDQNRQASKVLKPTLTLDLNYHQIITEAAHNHLLQERLNMLKAQISCSMLNWRQIEATSKEDLQRVLDEHWMIYQAIRRRWNDSAKSLMENHIMTALEKHLERIDTLTSKK